MSTPTTHQVTRLLLAWRSGESAAPERLMTAVYEELRRMARGYLVRERGGHTLQPTALVHEAYLRLVDETQIDWQSRAHFFAIAARVMRRVLVDHARRNAAAKRGAGAANISWEDIDEIPERGGMNFVALDSALQNLALVCPRQSEVVELKFFGGLTGREISEVLQVSERTVVQDWDFARSWLKRELDREGQRA